MALRGEGVALRAGSIMDKRRAGRLRTRFGMMDSDELPGLGRRGNPLLPSLPENHPGGCRAHTSHSRENEQQVGECLLMGWRPHPWAQGA